MDPDPRPSTSLSVGKTAAPTTLNLAGRNPDSDTVTVAPMCDRIAASVRIPRAISFSPSGKRPCIGVGRNAWPWPGLIAIASARTPLTCSGTPVSAVSQLATCGSRVTAPIAGATPVLFTFCTSASQVTP
jgi:hypothetical protein